MSLAHFTLTKIKDEHACIVDAGTIEVAEVNEDGAGKALFNHVEPALYIKHAKNQPPIRWTKNQKCADGAIILYAEGEPYLHIIELKKSVSSGKWEDIKYQFDGMICNALAMMAVLGMPRPVQIVCHIAYETEKLSAANATNPVLLKPMVGMPIVTSASLEWENCTVDLQHSKGIILRKIIRQGPDSIGVGVL